MQVTEVLKLILSFMTDLVKSRDERTLDAAQTSQARNYTIGLFVVSIIAYYVSCSCV